MAGGVKVECVTVGEVVNFAQRTAAEARPGETLPVSLSRAQGWSRNPHASLDDVALAVGYADGRPAGALGLVPGVALVDGVRHKIAWLSNFYVAESARATGLGGMLVLRAMSLGLDLFNTGFSDDAGAVYRAIGFKPFGPLDYLRADLRRQHLLDLPVRAARKLTRKIPPLHAVADAMGRGVNALAKQWLYGQVRGRLLEELQKLNVDWHLGNKDTEFSELEDAEHPTRFVRGSEVIDWMINDPWVVSGDSPPKPPGYFRDWAQRFLYVTLQIYRPTEDRYLGFVVLRMEERDYTRMLTVYDRHFREPADASCLAAVALWWAQKFRADMIQLPAECRPMVDAWGVGHWFQPEQRQYLAHLRRGSLLRDALPRFHLDMPDGDTAFA